MEINRNLKTVFCTFIGLLFVLGGRPAAAQVDQSIYTDSLQNGWQNWSWSTTNTTVTSPASLVHSGASSLSVTYTAAYAGLQFHTNGSNLANYTAISFWINSNGSANSTHNIYMYVVTGASNLVSVPITSYIPGGVIPTTGWTQVTVPLSAFNATTGTVSNVVLQEEKGSPEPIFYIDDMKLVAPTTGTLAINTSSIVHTLDARTFGMNTAVWDSSFNTSATISLLNAANNSTLRFPGGSASDGYNWQTNLDEGQTYPWATSFDAFANVATQTHANVYLTANYGGNGANGSGTPQSAAAWVTYSNITKKYGFKYWEIGNECYGSWENDHNTSVTDTSIPRPQDPYVYGTRAVAYINAMKAVDPTIKIGVVAVTGEDTSDIYTTSTDASAINPRTGVKHYGWTPVMLQTMKNLGVLPDFLIYHRYDGAPGQENDATLLQAASTWPNDVSNLRQQLNDYLGTSASKVEIDCTENNSVYGNPGKQSTSLVNGLYMADSIGNTYQTELNTVIWWDLRNGQDTTQNNSPSLYGWRLYGDYGIMSSANDCYPTYYVGKLLALFGRGGDQIVSANSNFSLLSVYAAQRTDGSITALVINKSPTLTLTGSLNFTNALPRVPLTIYSYGMTQDNAGQTTPIGSTARDIATTTATWPASGNFSYAFAPYSVSVLKFVGAGAINGQIALEGLDNLSGANTAAPVGTVHVGFRTPGTTAEIWSADVPLTPVGTTAFGTFSVSGAPRGTYDIGFKGGKQLRTVLHNVAVSATTALADLTLYTGDADNSNNVDTADFNILAGAFGESAGVVGSAYDVRADFNYDGIVDTADFNVMVGNFGNAGDN